MSRFADQPKAPPQSGAAEVAPATLALFPARSRADLPDEPDYDRTRPTKYWADATAASRPPDEIIPYVVYLKGKGRTIQMVRAAEAATFNLPGIHALPEWKPLPTKSYTVDPNSGVRAPLPVDMLSDRAEADALAAAWSAIDGQQYTVYDGTPDPVAHNITVYDDEDKRNDRKEWFIHGGKFIALVVGKFIAKQNAPGVGNVGHWDLSGGEPVWISDTPHTTVTENAELPIPGRDLLSNERCYFDAFGVGPIYRTDIPGPHNQATGSTNAPAAAGVWTAGQVSQLLADVASCKRNVAALFGLMNPPA